MPGLAGLAGTESALRNPQIIFKTLKQVGANNGVTYLYKSFHADEAAILNTSTGLLSSSHDQPGSCPAGNAFLFLEGEIFNLDELKGHLTTLWDPSPCGVLLALFLEQGERFIDLVNGEFNIVIYEKMEKRLSIFSDHMASMPMYYLEQDGCLYFGSEKKYILSLVQETPTIDSVGLLQIVAHGCNLDDRTFLSGIKRMMPGIRLTFQRGRIEVSRYHLLTCNIPERTARTEDLLEEWVHRLQEATLLRLQGKGRILISLSGGLDSRAVACAIPRHVRPISSRTRGVAGSLDCLLAAEIAECLRFDHHQEDPGSTLYSEIIPKIAWRTECETHFMNALSIADHASAKMLGDHIAGGWLGGPTSGNVIKVDMLWPRSRRQFIEHAFDRHLVCTEHSLRKIFTRDFLEQTLPDLKEAFFASFDYLEGSSNLYDYEVWDLYQKQTRLTNTSMMVDSYLFEKIRPLYDKGYLEFTLSLPSRLRFGQVLYQAMIYSLGPEIRHIPYANNQLRVRRSCLGNLGNKSLTLAHRTMTRAIRRVNPMYRNRIERRTSENLGEAIRRDAGFRRSVEQFLDSSDFDPSIFSQDGIRAMLDEHFHASSDHSKLLGHMAIFSVGMPYFLKRTLHCPPEAEPLSNPSTNQ